MCLPLTYVVQRIEFIVFYMSLHWPFRCAAYRHHNPLWALSLSLSILRSMFSRHWVRCWFDYVAWSCLLQLALSWNLLDSPVAHTLSLCRCLPVCLLVCLFVCLSLSPSLSLFNYAFQRIDLYYSAAVNYQTFTNGCPQFRYAVQCITCNVVQCN